MNFDRYTLPFIIRSGRRLKVARGIGRDAEYMKGEVLMKSKELMKSKDITICRKNHFK